MQINVRSYQASANALSLSAVNLFNLARELAKQHKKTSLSLLTALCWKFALRECK